MIRSVRKTQTATVSFEDGERTPQAKNVGGLWKLRTTPLQEPAGRLGPQSYNHTDVNSANNLNQPGSKFSPSPTAPTPNLSPMAQSRETRQAHRTFDLQNCKTIPLCCLKLLNLW